MSRALALSLLLSLLGSAPPLLAQDDPSNQTFSPDQLDNLLAPVALYPDPVLAQILLAATFPDQLDEAARFCRGGANADDIDTQPWDVSVKAVAHYPTVLYMMADNLDWTTALGQAYVNQTGDVMAAVQRLRQEARNAGNLASTPQQDVEVDDGGDIEIWPAQPQYCYLPVYDPSLVFFGSGGVFGGPIVTFGAGLPIGAWLNNDFDWRHRRIYYRGWKDRHGWIPMSRPYIHINNVYVNDNLKNIAVNRSVTARPVNYANLNRYNSVHRDAEYGNARSTASVSNAPGNNVNNKIIQRNGNVNDARIDSYRGRAADQPTGGQPTGGQASPNRAAPPPATERTGNAAFGGNRSNIDTKASSQRGQSSRAQASAPARSSGGGGFHGGGGGGGGGGGSHGGGGGRH
ncbi:MAG TPA: DUF3300 domain-containing protein [Bryobacteraceae bacterium]|jgi:uncharacterized membrane protein YgcG|nr:DUF3300 domain-containing protein [Bryobacteraceae bacterium]